MVEFLDSAVSEGRAPSRAALVSSAIEREMRRLAAERDFEVLKREGPADDLDGAVDWIVANVQIED